MTVVRRFAQDSGTCGENLTWTFDEGTGTLTISGTGAMADYAQTGKGGPWSYSFYVDLLKQVIIEEGVTSIGSYAFSEHGKGSSYFTVSIANSVKSIGECAFRSCSGLTSVTIGNGVTNIGNVAFYWCPDLTSIEVDSENPLYSSENGVLFDKEKTTLVMYPDGKQGNYVIPNGITSIGSRAFDGSQSPTAIFIPASVTSIGDYAFCDRGDLRVVEVSWENPISIELSSFCWAPLSKFTLIVPQGTSEAYRAADVWKYFGTIVEANSSTSCENPVDSGSFGENDMLNWSLCEDGTLTISGFGDMPDYVEANGTPWYSHQKSITAVVIESGVTTIGDHVFDHYSDLKSVTIPNSVASIKPFAFSGCSGLTSITVSWEKLPDISNLSWFDEVDLSAAQLIVPYGTKMLYEAAPVWRDFGAIVEKVNTAPESGTCGENLTWTFDEETTTLTISGTGTMTDYDWDNNEAPWNLYQRIITALKIENGVTSIGNNAFTYCSGLTSVTIPDSATSIGANAFIYCSGLTSIIIPNSVESIGGWAFRRCSNLSSIIIPNSVTSIGIAAFSGCSGLTSITIPNSVTSIGSHAFSDCSGLTSIIIPNSVISIDIAAFSGCSSLTSLIIPNSVESIGGWAFLRCSNLSSIIIPNSVTSIGSGVFSGCSSLRSVTIPNSVTSIGSDAFNGCSGLTSVIVPWDSPLPISDLNLFYDIYLSAVQLIVPYGTKALYEAAPVWQDFGTIVEKANNVEESVTNGSYESVITDLNFEFEDGTVVVEGEIE